MSIRERHVDVRYDRYGEIPCSIWSATERPQGVVLLGHGLGVDRYDRTVRRPMEILTQEHEAAVVVPEIPLHGVRDNFPNDPSGIVDRWQRFWISGGAEVICGELQRLVSFCRESFRSLPIAYFGLSLGTQYGIPFLAQTIDIRSAALGLFGSHPPPKTPLMNRYAPDVHCPVYFVQKIDDEIHSAESTTHLFSTIGSVEKVLDSTKGKHGETSLESLRSACAFLVHRGRRGASG
jgi:hypothetical protein